MSTDTPRALRGFRDVLPPESERAAGLENLARRELGRYGFREIRLPTLEQRELFVKSTGETSDIVEKEMFTLEDQGGRRLALRPEGTPGAVRAYLEAGLPQRAPRQKLFYIGSMFRAERPQAGRYREFIQIGAESLGNPSPAADAELILALADLLQAAGLKRGDYALHINTLGDEEPACRPAYRLRLLDYLRGAQAGLCENCRRRLERNPLRALDCKADGPRLRAEAPQLAPCAPCRGHFEAVLDLLKRQEEPFLVDPLLVRGLDYYTRTVFEFKIASLGAQDAVGAGGRYDALVEGMGGPSTPAVGWAMGLERTLKALEGKQAPAPGAALVFVLTQKKDPEQARQAFDLMQALRREKLRVDGGLFAKTLTAQLQEAERSGARYAVILGEEELRRGECSVKNLADRSQVQLPQDRLAAYLKERFQEKPECPPSRRA